MQQFGLVKAALPEGSLSISLPSRSTFDSPVPTCRPLAVKSIAWSATQRLKILISEEPRALLIGHRGASLQWVAR